MAMIYIKDSTAKKFREAAKEQRRTPSATLEVLLESVEYQPADKSLGHTENRLSSVPGEVKQSSTV